MGVIQGQDDSPLTEAGKDSSVAKAEKLRPFPISAVFSSDLPRARTTLQIIQRSLPGLPPPQFTRLLREIDFGEYTGSVKEAIIETIMKHKSDTSIKYPGGESGADLSIRVAGFMDALPTARDGSYVLAVTHYGVIETIVKRYAGFPAGDHMKLGEDDIVSLGFDGGPVASLDIL